MIYYNIGDEYDGTNRYVSLDKRAKKFVDSIPFEDLPKYVNDSRFLIKEFVLKRLKLGNRWDKE